MAWKDGKNLTVAFFGFAEFLFIFVHHAKIDQCRHRYRWTLNALAIVFHGPVVVAEQIIDISQFKKGSGVIPVQLNRLFKILSGGFEISAQGEQATLLEEVFGCFQAGHTLQNLLRLIHRTHSTVTTCLVETGVAYVEFGTCGSDKCLGGFSPALLIFQSDAPEITDEPRFFVCHLIQAFQGVAVLTHKHVCHTKTLQCVVGDFALNAIANR